MKNTQSKVNIIGELDKIKVRFIRYFFPGYIATNCRKKIDKGNIKAANIILQETVKYHPNKSKLICLFIETYVALNKWNEAEYYFSRLLIENPGEIPVDLYGQFSLHYVENSMLEEYEEVIEKAFIYYKNNNIVEKLLDVLLEKKDWVKIKMLYDRTISKHFHILSEDNPIKIGMVLKVIGENEKANALLSQGINATRNTEVSVHKKLILFDNGESRIEYYKRLSNTNKVIITFDSINMEWHSPPFSYKLLARQNIDIIAVRKRKKATYQQDLTQEDFVATLEKLVNGYEDKISYGYSLGAYNALYFATLLDCRILAIAPRLSIHPSYGRKAFIGLENLLQKETLPYNNSISPIIVYDPYNGVDNKYVTQGVLPAFPNSECIIVRYGGHGMAPHLLKMGQLKEFILDVIDKKVPVYNRKLRTKSFFYFRLLANRCVNHNKHIWALNLVERSLELMPTDKFGIKLKLRILKEMERIQGARSYLIWLIEEYPDKVLFRIYLIEFYTDHGDYEAAYKVLNITLEKFGELPSIMKVQKRLDETV